MAYVTALAIFLGSMLVQLTDAKSTVYDSKTSSGYTTSQSRTQTRKHTECSCVCTNTSIQTTKDVFEQSTTNLFKDVSPTIAKQSTKKTVSSTATASANPASCRVVCDDVIRGLIHDTPIGLASRGAEAEIFPEFWHGGIRVYCDCTNGSEEAWTVFQRRVDGSISFYRNWSDYVNGFGNASGNLWLGLEFMNKFTESRDSQLRIDMEDFDENKAYAEYNSFIIGKSSTNYTLMVDRYNGDAGENLIFCHGTGVSNLMPFSTFDRDNSVGSCASRWTGAWWFDNCFCVHLNGVYSTTSQVSIGRGIHWNEWKGFDHSLKSVEMKMRN